MEDTKIIIRAKVGEGLSYNKKVVIKGCWNNRELTELLNKLGGRQ